MPTKNRRVATYLPPELDNLLKDFIDERGLKGESLALITILSEYFGVNHKVSSLADHSGFVAQKEFSELTAKVNALTATMEASNSPSNALSELHDKLRQIENRIGLIESTVKKLRTSEGIVSNHEAPPGQISLPIYPGGIASIESESSSESSEVRNTTSSGLHSNLQPLSGYALSKRIGKSRGTLSQHKDEWWENNPEKLIEWIKKEDPDGVTWNYNPANKKYYPVIDDSLVG